MQFLNSDEKSGLSFISCSLIDTSLVCFLIVPSRVDFCSCKLSASFKLV